MSRRPLTIAILSGKGGVGKTTICLNLARRLSESCPVWLVDTDLFNRGTTSALWESERSIPLSVAELILKLTAPPGGAMEPDPHSPGDHVRTLSEQIRSCRPHLTYTNNLFALPAARASEGREASCLLWRGVNERGLSAEDFLAALLEALDRITPRSIVLLDGHGGLDELSIAAAIVSDVTYIVNEPDLITFTGSITLYQEISRACEARHVEPRIEFIINRVPPNKSVLKMELDFGDVLRTISPAKEPVAAYFPLERELFGIFGDDPFVSEIYTEFWFSKKIRLIARQLIEHGVLARPLEEGGREKKRDAAIRTALRREFHKRGGHLLVAWLVFLIATQTTFLLALLRGSGSAKASFLPSVEPLIVLSMLGLVLADQTRRWLRVQRVHLGNARRVRAARGRRLRLGDSESAKLREALETKAKEKAVGRGLRWAISAFVILGLLVALAVPNFLDALQKAKQKRTIADVRNVGTAMFSWLVDQVGAAAGAASRTPGGFVIMLAQEIPEGAPQNYNVQDVPAISPERLREVLVPTYIQEIPLVDGWGHPYEYRLNVENPLGKTVMVIRSPGRDGRYERDLYEKDVFDPTDYDQDILWADGFFIRMPGQSSSARALRRHEDSMGRERARPVARASIFLPDYAKDFFSMALMKSGRGTVFSTSPASSPARRACSTP